MQATGIRLGTVFQSLCAFIAGLVIALLASWELTVLVLVIFPAIVFIYIVQQKELEGRVHKNKQKLEESGEIVVESILNIHTVAALGVEDYFFQKYCQQLKALFRYVSCAKFPP